MELPRRPRGDEYTKPGEYPELRRRLREASRSMEIPSVVAYAFDKRTRLLPYFFTSHHMAPAGARSVGSALVDSGLTCTRIVLQQWTPNFRPSLARLNGNPIEMLLVSSMQIHAERAYDLVRDAARMGAGRPLIIAGGPKTIYEPWDLFDIDGDPDCSADVACTGEEFVLMQLIEVLLTYRGRTGTMLEAFRHARRDGALEAIPGLVYRQEDTPDAPLLSTGIQRLVQNLDEFPHPITGYSLLEKPHRGRELKRAPIPISRLWMYSQISSLSISHGCKFNCDYCPIPAYNQRTYRYKSGARIVDEMRRIRLETGIQFFFGTDDNFFNGREAVEQMLETMSSAVIGGKPLRKMARWGTEATEFDTWKNRDLLPLAREAGLRAIWFGIEDLTATLIKKGQSVNKTAELFALLNSLSINPMPMMMHHDGQPLYSREGLYGLLNQVKFLRNAGAQSLQVTVLTPAVGTRSYEPTYEKGLVFKSVGSEPVYQCRFDGNHVVASTLDKPWRTQLNVLAAYASFYNPLNLIRAIIKPNNSLVGATAFDQLRGMMGLCVNIVDSTRWAWKVRRGPIERCTAPPGPKRPMIDVSPRAMESDAEALPTLTPAMFAPDADVPLRILNAPESPVPLTVRAS